MDRIFDIDILIWIIQRMRIAKVASPIVMLQISTHAFYFVQRNLTNGISYQFVKIYYAFSRIFSEKGMFVRGPLSALSLGRQGFHSNPSQTRLCDEKIL